MHMANQELDSLSWLDDEINASVLSTPLYQAVLALRDAFYRH